MFDFKFTQRKRYILIANRYCVYVQMCYFGGMLNSYP